MANIGIEQKQKIIGVTQGGLLSFICSNVCLDKLDKELEWYVDDDVLIFTKREMVANRMMKSICSWL